MQSATYTLRGGPHAKLKLTFPNKDNLPPAFRLVKESDLGVWAPDAVYVLKVIAQKNRTIKVYEYEPRGINYFLHSFAVQRYKALLRTYNRGTQ